MEPSNLNSQNGGQPPFGPYTNQYTNQSYMPSPVGPGFVFPGTFPVFYVNQTAYNGSHYAGPVIVYYPMVPAYQGDIPYPVQFPAYSAPSPSMPMQTLYAVNQFGPPILANQPQQPLQIQPPQQSILSNPKKDTVNQPVNSLKSSVVSLPEETEHKPIVLNKKFGYCSVAKKNRNEENYPYDPKHIKNGEIAKKIFDIGEGVKVYYKNQATVYFPCKFICKSVSDYVKTAVCEINFKESIPYHVFLNVYPNCITNLQQKIDKKELRFNDGEFVMLINHLQELATGQCCAELVQVECDETPETKEVNWIRVIKKVERSVKAPIVSNDFPLLGGK